MALTAILYSRYGARNRADLDQQPEFPPDPHLPDNGDFPAPFLPAVSERLERYDDLLPSAEPGFSFLFSYTVRWRIPADSSAEPGEGFVRDLVRRRVADTAKKITVGDPALVAELVTKRLRDGVSIDATDSEAPEVRVEDVDVRVDGDTVERWRSLAEWRREVDLASAKYDHLDRRVWTSPRDALLWHLAQQPDLDKAVGAIDPVRRLLLAFAGREDSVEAGEHQGAAHSDVPLSVQMIKQAFPDDHHMERLFAMKFARLLEGNDRPAMAKEVKDVFAIVD
ncbi:hypothetical protein [Frankia sp. AiPa1]|uniref:hypothetical protein n=1 Tax=Frankia sp. AiPa1 TaxID=573492 RepID=UPI00202B2B63|nr:hypothetical protein [Frankia sp. AiPa1]MCL9758157.1 hypothetical protein [Frankia sp. AiPa1]